jgi:hypothetical protein
LASSANTVISPWYLQKIPCFKDVEHVRH